MTEWSKVIIVSQSLIVNVDWKEQAKYHFVGLRMKKKKEVAHLP